MYKGKKICVIVPALNEELLLPKTIAGIPEWVDKIIIIDDGSTDNMPSFINEIKLSDSRIQSIDHESNKGLGQSLIDGYLAFRKTETDICVVMAGDNQMSPKDLPRLLDPIIAGEVDYVKGNRLLRDDVKGRMPLYRYIGNGVLTLLTKIATGYWKLIDPQCGYTAITKKAINIIPIETMIKGYGYNAHILNMLNLSNFVVKDVEVEPVYGEEKSKIKLISYIFNVSLLLLRLTLKRLINKYLIRDFHPLFLFYIFSLLQIFFISFPLLVRFIYIYSSTGFFPQTTLLLFYVSLSLGIFSGLIGMWLDMDENKSLNK